jgi:hypothetical protein
MFACCGLPNNRRSYVLCEQPLNLWRTNMSNSDRDLKLRVTFGLVGAVALMAGLAAFAAPRSASALPAYAQQTGLACGRCHVNPAGGGARNAFGKAFAANGHAVPSATGSSKTSVHGEIYSAPPVDLDTSARVPVFFGDFRGARPPNAYSDISQ